MCAKRQGRSTHSTELCPLRQKQWMNDAERSPLAIAKSVTVRIEALVRKLKPTLETSLLVPLLGSYPMGLHVMSILHCMYIDRLAHAYESSLRKWWRMHAIVMKFCDWIAESRGGARMRITCAEHVILGLHYNIFRYMKLNNLRFKNN